MGCKIIHFLPDYILSKIIFKSEFTNRNLLAEAANRFICLILVCWFSPTLSS